MTIRKLNAEVLSLAMLVALAGGAGPPPQGPATARDGRSPGPEPARGGWGWMIVEGRVLDAEGRPVPGAMAMVYASLTWPGRGDRPSTMWPSPLGRARCDGSGRFRLDAPRVSSARHHGFGAVAIATGYGAGWVELDPDADRPAAEIRLRPEQVIRGRLFDAQGRLVPGVVVSVESMTRAVGDDPARAAGEGDGPYFLTDQAQGLPAWPRPAMTDPDGRFTIRGVGRGLRVVLAVDDPRFAPLRMELDTDAPSGVKVVKMVVEPARIISGRVTYADTGRIAAHARISLGTRDEKSSAWAGDCETDAHGRFLVNPRVGAHYSVTVFAPDDAPYLTASFEFAWPRGSLAQAVDVAMPPGVLVRGRVVEEGSGRPVAGARVGYLSSPNKDPRTGAANGRATTADDGTFRLGVVPGPGYLTVLGPGEDYVRREIGQRMASAGRPGGRRLYAHAFERLDLEPGDINVSRDVTIALRPSTPVPVEVVGPDGRPARDVSVIGRDILQPTWIAWQWWKSSYYGIVHDGHFTVHGLADDAEVPVYFLDARHGLGATARLSGRSAADGPVTVRLEPMGAARARLVDPAGRPIPRPRPDPVITTMVVTPGPGLGSVDRADLDRLAADEDVVARLDPIHHEKGPVPDGRGFLTVPALIPGATYRIYDATAGADARSRLRGEFTARAGETIDLGDLRIEQPGG